jgi:Uma2 family endonuclease
MTAEELFKMPDDGYRYELVGGELRKMAPPGQYHGEYAGTVFASLHVHVRANNLGKTYTEIGFHIETNPDHVRAPDVAFISHERLEAIGESPGYFPSAPDLAIEVISPNDRLTRVNEKVRDWLDAGTRMVIVVNPRRREATVHLPGEDPITLTQEDTLDGGDVVWGWQMPVRDIFS